MDIVPAQPLPPNPVPTGASRLLVVGGSLGAAVLEVSAADVVAFLGSGFGTASGVTNVQPTRLTCPG